MRMNRMATAAFWLSTVALTALGPDMIARAFAADPLGTWYTEDHDSQVRISKCGSGVCGALVWLKTPNDANGRPRPSHAKRRCVEAQPTSPRRGNRSRYETERHG